MKWYPWLTPYYKAIIHHYQQRPHHALLLHTPAMFGERALINALARRLLCQTPNGDRTCGQCHACQLMMAETHPDYSVIAAANNKTSITIDQIRQLTNKLHEHAQQGGAKVIYIDMAETLTHAAANALLKCLEEPAAKTFFILTCQQPEQLLVTIKSRCLRWLLRQPAENYSLQWLAQQIPNQMESDYLTALRLSLASPLQALQLLNSSQWQHRIHLIQTLHQAIMQGSFLHLLPLFKKDHLLEQFDWCLCYWQDILKYASNNTAYIANQDSLARIAEIAPLMQVTSILALYQEWLSCRQKLLTIPTINSELLLSNLLLKTEQYCHH